MKDREDFARDVADESEADVVRLWIFPEDEIDEWNALMREEDPGGTPYTYAEYRAAIAGIAEAVTEERPGIRVDYIEFPVSEMRKRLGRYGLPNRADSRSLVTAWYPESPAGEALTRYWKMEDGE